MGAEKNDWRLEPSRRELSESSPFDDGSQPFGVGVWSSRALDNRSRGGAVGDPCMISCATYMRHLMSGIIQALLCTPRSVHCLEPSSYIHLFISLHVNFCFLDVYALSVSGIRDIVFFYFSPFFLTNRSTIACWSASHSISSAFFNSCYIAELLGVFVVCLVSVQAEIYFIFLTISL